MTNTALASCRLSLLQLPLFALDRNLRKSGKSEGVSRRRRYVDNAPANKRAAIIDRHHDRAPVAAIGDQNPGSERKRTVGRGQRPRIKPRAARGPGAALRRINRCESALAVGSGIGGGERKQLNKGGNQTNRSEGQCNLPCCRDGLAAIVVQLVFVGKRGV